jgi:predicted metalloprotease
MQGYEEVTDGSYQPTEEEHQSVTLTKQVLAGTAQSSTGPFHRSKDQCIYLDVNEPE